MGEAAIQVARSVNYTNAGTVEFLVNDKNEFFFLEMNTRLQVEHPITEAITGCDIVKWQIRIANGEPLTMKQSDLHQQGHAIECRIYAEDPSNHFFPSTGRVHLFQPPHGPQIRNDVGLDRDGEVTIHYDSLLAKLIVHSENRQSSLEKIRWALANYKILGVTTNIPFLRAIVDHPSFESGSITTHFIDDHLADFAHTKEELPMEALIAVSLADEAFTSENGAVTTRAEGDPHSPWKKAERWGR